MVRYEVTVHRVLFTLCTNRDWYSQQKLNKLEHFHLFSYSIQPPLFCGSDNSLSTLSRALLTVIIRSFTSLVKHQISTGTDTTPQGYPCIQGLAPFFYTQI